MFLLVYRDERFCEGTGEGVTCGAEGQLPSSDLLSAGRILCSTIAISHHLIAFLAPNIHIYSIIMVMVRITAIKNREKYHIDETLTHFLFVKMYSEPAESLGWASVCRSLTKNGGDETRRPKFELVDTVNHIQINTNTP